MSDNLSGKQLEMVFISHWFGHTPHFAECVLPFFLERGYRIYHLTDKPDEAGVFLSSVFGERASAISNLAIDVVEPQKPSQGKELHHRRVEAHWRGVGSSLRRLFGELGRSVGIFHSWVDLYSHEYLERRVIEEAMPAPWCGLYVHPAELRIYKTWKRRLLENARDFFKQGRVFPCRLRAFDVPMARKIYFLDEGILGSAKPIFNDHVKLASFPEWLDGAVSSHFDFINDVSKLAQGRKIVCLCGFLSKRKGLLTLLKAAVCLNEKWFFVFAGPIEWESFNKQESQFISGAIKNGSAGFLFINRLIKDQEVNAVVQKSDLVYIAYENFFHSSNVQLKAAFFGKPVIAGPQHLIAERTKRFKTGWCLPELSQKAVLDLLNRIDEKEIGRVSREARFEEFCHEHSPERLRVVLGEICELVG
jgi:hypothetical protein